MFQALLLQRFLAIGMCCLTVLGAAPRLDCLCASAACQAACESSMLVAAPQEKSCCCHQESPAPTSGPPHVQPVGCHCDMHVSQEQLSPVARDDAPPLVMVCWLRPASDSLTSGPQRSQDDLALASSLPPDDPVSRAQILRL